MEAELGDLKQTTEKDVLDDSNLELLEEQAEQELGEQELGFRQSIVTTTT